MVPQSLSMKKPKEKEVQSEVDNESADGDVVRRKASTKHKWKENDENIVQWKQNNIKDGFVVVDEAQLSKLIKREPVEKHYRLEKEPFAKGLFSSVRRCQSLESGESFAAKFSSRDRYGEDCSAEIYHEIALLSLCGGASRIIQIHDVFENEKEIVLVMEYAPGGDLQTIIDDNMVPFESDVLSFVRQTVEGLEYLHRRRIAHLDIKPQNIVMMGDFPNCDVKLCDLEISRIILEEDKIRDFLGTPDYVAPEVIHYDPITLAADMWSLGVTTYVLLTGFTPFGGESDQETFCNISRAEVDFPEELFEDVSEEAVDFIRSLLVKNPSARPTASDCLRHPWLSKKLVNNHWDESATRKEMGAAEQANRLRKGCQTCQLTCKHLEENQKALRKYLSKSREALFEKVIQHHKVNSISRNGAVNNHILSRTRRLCESQISLLSKSREKLYNRNSSRSTEKLYGLRSLSKSQEVLNLYKNGSLLTSQENIDKVSEILKSRENLLDKISSNDVDVSRDRRLTRAVTTDLGILHNRNKPSRTYSGSSTTSLASISIEVPEESVVKEEHPTTANSDKVKTVEIKEIENFEENKNLHEQDPEPDVEEPRFTVAQLITAYNKHQEIVTKTSLEVTMTAQEKKVKIPPIINYESNTPFPTGPTALRLFIPDIDLVEMPKKNRQRNKIRFVDYKSDTSEPNSGEWSRMSDCERSEETQPSKKEETTPNQSHLRCSSVSSNVSTMESPVSKKAFSQEELVPVSQREAAKEENVTFKSSLTERGEPRDQKRSKSASPNPPKKSECRKLSVNEDSRRFNSSAKAGKNPKRERKPPQGERFCASKQAESGTQYKIIGMSEKSANPAKKSSGVSYNIEFASPTVTRKFPTRNIPIRGTISSNLKSKELPVKTKKK